MLTPTDLPALELIPADLRRVLDRILDKEGRGFENDPDDPGGATKCGISLAFARAARLDVDGDGDTDLADIEAVSPALAQRIIFQKFYLEPGAGTLPATVRPVVLDSAFNCGIGGTAAILTTATSVLLGGSVSAPGAGLGRFGPPLQALILRLGPVRVVDQIVEARIARYRAIAERRPASQKFLNGWTLRALDFASTELRRRHASLLHRYGQMP